MAALEYLAKAGLTVEAVAGKLRASPADRLTPEIREFIGANKATLLAELQAANQQAHGLDRDQLRANEQTHATNSPLVPNVADDAAIKRQLHDAYISHIMGKGRASNCCYARAGRYCPEGQRLWDAYRLHP